MKRGRLPTKPQFQLTAIPGAYATTVLHELVGNPEAQDDML